MSRMQRRKPWYKKPAGICGIAAAVLVIVGLVLFFALRGSGQKEPEVPDDTQVEVPDNTPEPTPEPEPEPEPEPTPTPDPKPNPVSDTTIYTEGEQTDGVWNLILVNPWNPMPDNFTVELQPLSGTKGIDKRCYPQLQKMMDDCRAQGFNPYICSSYRTWDMQQENFNKQVQIWRNKGYSEEEAKIEAAKKTAIPGTSEHQLGLAVDIIDTNNWNLDDSQEKVPTQQWLMANSWRYGFILRYPNGTTSITGIIYEPWHYRYVGCKVAQEIYERGITFEEYLGRAEH